MTYKRRFSIHWNAANIKESTVIYLNVNRFGRVSSRFDIWTILRFDLKTVNQIDTLTSQNDFD